MTAFFEKILEMSATAAVVIVVLLVVRLLLKKAPRKYAYALWAAAAFRLVCPVSFRSVFSIFTLTEAVKLPVNTQPVVETIPPDVIATAPPTVITTPPPAVVTPPAVTVTPPVVTDPITAAVSFWDVAAVIWLAVLAGLLIYGVVSYVLLRRRMAKAVLLEGRVYQSERVRSPFILGFVRPKIYLPFGLTEEQQCYVLAHERHHIRRLDHIVRPVAFLILAVHWFNPLVWLAYYLMARDMEMSCDEKVLGGEENIRKAYSVTLLSFAANRRFPSPSPLSFGETGVKGRIKNILNWKKPALWVTILAVVAVIAVLLVCAADPAEPSDGITAEQEGEYRTVECIYMTPLSSYYSPDGDDGCSYTITSDHVIRDGQQLDVTSDWEELTEERWNELDFLFWETVLKEKVGTYQSQRVMTLSDGWYLMEMDGELWIAKLSEDPRGRTYFWSIYRLAKDGEEIEREPAFTGPTGWFRSVECVYTGPLYSFVPDEDSGIDYGVEEDALTIVYRASGVSYENAAEGGWQVLTEELWQEQLSVFSSTGHPWDIIERYSNRHIRHYAGGWLLLALDGEIWIGRQDDPPVGAGHLMELYRLTGTDEPEVQRENKLVISADLDRDGVNDGVQVLYDPASETYLLTVTAALGGNTLLEWELPSWPDTNAGYWLCQQDGKDYLLYWSPNGRQGVCHWSYELFYFDKHNDKVIVTEGLRQYDTSHIGMEHLTADLDDLRAFEQEINALLVNSVPVLVSERASGGGILIGPQDGPMLWKSPADEWEAQRQAHQEEADARERATLAVWPLEGDRLTITVLQSENDSYTIDVCEGDYYFWGNNIHRTAGTLLYFRYQDDYLMELSGGGQDGGIWSYRIFSVGPESLNVIRETQDTILTVDSAALRDFEAEVNELLEDAVLIAGVDGGNFVYNTPDRIAHVYRMEHGQAMSFLDSSWASATRLNIMVDVQGTADAAKFVMSCASEEVKWRAVEADSKVAVIDSVEEISTGDAGLWSGNYLYLVKYTLDDGGQEHFYLCTHEEWAAEKGEMEKQYYLLGLMTEEELRTRYDTPAMREKYDPYGANPGEAPYLAAVTELYAVWSEENSCLCSQ